MRKRAYSVCEAYSIGQPYEAGVLESKCALTASAFAATALASHTPSLEHVAPVVAAEFAVAAVAVLLHSSFFVHL